MPTAFHPSHARLAALAILYLGTAGGVRAADFPLARDVPVAMPASVTGGGYWAPLVPRRPVPTRFDIYGYPILGPGLVGRPALGVGCPPALQPAYDPDGNLAGYAPLQYCR